jgi:hypothetical protein
MRWIKGAIAWVYDFLAEDVTLLIGTAVAIVVVVLAVHTVRNAAGIILFFVVAIVITASLWRTVSASKT